MKLGFIDHIGQSGAHIREDRLGSLETGVAVRFYGYNVVQLDSDHFLS